MENPAEVQELRNKLRMMKFPQDEILNTVRRQQRAIHKQKQANDTIRQEIIEYETEIGNVEHRIQVYKTDEELQRLQNLQKNLTNKLNILNSDLLAEEQKRKKLEDEVSKANSKAGGFFQQSRENEELQARLRTMENRLDKALVRYNNGLTKLADLRNRIDELRKDRFTFQNVIRTAEKDLENKDQDMQRLISESNAAYTERDRKKMDLVQIKSAEKEDIQTYEQDIQRINQTIEGQRISQAHPHDQQTTVPSINSQIGSQTDQQEELVQLTDQYQATIQKTLDQLGMKDVQELFSEADKIERENFSLYTFVVEHGSKKTKLQEEIDALELQHESIMAQVEKGDADQSDRLAEMTQTISETESELHQIESAREKEDQEFQEVYNEIESLFNSLGCSWNESPDEKANVTPANAMFCLSAIEATLADIMNNVADKATTQYQLRGVDPKSIGAEDSKSEAMRSQIHKSLANEPAIPQVTKQPIESSKPLSIEELRAML